MEGKNLPLNICYPPDFVFKYRKPSRIAPAKEVIKPQGTFDFVGVKYPPIYKESDEFFEKSGMKREWFKYPVNFRRNPETNQGEIYVVWDYPPLTPEEEKMGGQLTCFKDCPYPFKGHPFPEAIYAINAAKRVTKLLVEHFITKDTILIALGYLFLPRKKKNRLLARMLHFYYELTSRQAEAYILDKKFMTKYGQEIYDFCERFIKKMNVDEYSPRKIDGLFVSWEFAESFSSQIDWDNAYWMRMGDAFQYVTKEEMLKDPVKTLRKIGKIFIEHNKSDLPTAQRLEKAFKYVSYLLYVPKYRRIFLECVKESNFENFQFDDADRYHVLPYADYNYLGKTFEERMLIYKEYHEKHPPFPPRIQINP